MASQNNTPKTPSALYAAMHGGGTMALQEIHKAAYAIEAAQRALEAASERDDDVIDGYTIGGLKAGIEILSGVIQDNASSLLDWLGATPWHRADREKIDEAASAAQ